MQDQLEYIEEYLKGNLSEGECRDFEAKMKNDDALNEKVENHRSFLKGIELGFNRELKSLLKREDQKQISSSSNRQIRLRNYFVGIAATVALILVSVYSIRNQQMDSNELFVNYYTAYPNVEAPISRSGGNTENAYSFYEQGNYPRALELFSKLIKENAHDPAPVFYSGICNLELDHVQSARSFFESIQKLDQNKYSKPALWYEALSNLKLNNKQEAINILNNLARGEDVHAKRAMEVLEYLD